MVHSCIIRGDDYTLIVPRELLALRLPPIPGGSGGSAHSGGGAGGGPLTSVGMLLRVDSLGPGWVFSRSKLGGMRMIGAGARGRSSGGGVPIKTGEGARRLGERRVALTGLRWVEGGRVDCWGARALFCVLIGRCMLRGRCRLMGRRARGFLGLVFGGVGNGERICFLTGVTAWGSVFSSGRSFDGTGTCLMTSAGGRGAGLDGSSMGLRGASCRVPMLVFGRWNWKSKRDMYPGSSGTRLDRRWGCSVGVGGLSDLGERSPVEALIP
jgi:hypothetical protein